MNPENTQKLLKRFPVLYQDYYSPMSQTCMCWGFDHCDGWFDIIWQLSLAIEDELHYSWLQKKKFLLKKAAARRWNGLIYKISKPRTEDPIGKFFKAIRPKSMNEGQYYKRKWYLGGLCWAKLELGLKMLVQWPYTGFAVGQVKEKYGCYDEQTEVLTNHGWKFFKDVTLEDAVATLKDGQKLFYQRPTDIIKEHYSGPMYRLKTRGVDLLVTPNHCLYVAKGSYYNGRYSPPKRVDRPFELVTPAKYFGKNKRFKKSAIWQGWYLPTFVLPKYENFWQNNLGLTNKKYPNKTIETNDWLAFLGWYVAEGCSSKINGVAVACNNTDGGAEKKTIKDVIDRLNVKYSLSSEDRPALLFRIYNKQLSTWLSQHCGKDSYSKKVPEFIKILPPEQIKVFLDALYQGDGHLGPTYHVLTTVSKRLADDVQELILKVGQTSSLSKRPPRAGLTPVRGRFVCSTVPAYCVNWLKRSDDHNTSNKGLAPKRSSEETVQYDGMVYCVTVPDHVIYVRRHGTPVWCGNSLRFYCPVNDRIDLFVSLASRASSLTCETCGKRGRRRGLGWLYTACAEHSHDEDLDPKEYNDEVEFKKRGLKKTRKRSKK